jgi:Flp pilus assembly protein TadG
MGRLLTCRKGTAAIEFALIAPVFLALMLGIIEFGYQMWIRVSLDYALAQATRCWVLGYADPHTGVSCTSLAGAKSALQVFATGVPFAAGVLTVTSSSAGCLAYTYTAQWLVPGLMPAAAPVFTNTACYYY